MRELKNLLKALFVVFIATLILRHGVFSFYIVEGSSMNPTLQEGERVAVNKLVYRFREPSYGDVIVFKNPAGDNRVFVKRIVAVAGDRVAIHNGMVLVNGQALEEEYIEVSTWESMDEIVVSPGCIFVMGDNRGPGGSLDSRRFGPVAIGEIVGRTEFVLYPRPHKLD